MCVCVCVCVRVCVRVRVRVCVCVCVLCSAIVCSGKVVILRIILEYSVLCLLVAHAHLKLSVCVQCKG